MKTRLSLCLVILTFIGAVSGCAPAIESYPSLANQGPLNLSTTNPYLGANLFVARELEHSTYLFNFFKTRGAPVAVEIIEPNLGVPRLLMYYPLERETYAADSQRYQASDGRIRTEWIIRGPFQIEREDLRTLARMEAAMTGEPVFNIWGKPYRFRFQQHEQPSVKGIEPEVPPTPVPLPKKTTPKNHPVITVKQNERVPAATPTPKEFRPLSSDQQAIQMSRGFARRAENGDVLHLVRKEGETVEQITKWYTGSAAALTEVATLNGKPAAEPLLPGSTITIPVRLVKQFKAMP